jgi:hypothetical protein
MGKSFGHINCFSINSDRDCLFSDETRCIVLDHVHDFFLCLLMTKHLWMGVYLSVLE